MTRRLDPVPLILLVLLAGATAWVWRAQQRAAALEFQHFDEASLELEPLRSRYGPDKFSENHEEWIIRDFFQDRRGGFFLDVGAHHYRNQSNTYYLETALDWSGIAVEPQTQFADDYARHRPRTRFVPMFASDEAGASVQLFVPANNPLVASADPNFPRSRGYEGDARTVPTTTLNVLLEQAGVTAIDFLSMDIETHEPQALAGFNLTRYRPAFVCIEGHPTVRQQILNHFHDHGYRLVGKYLRMDPRNLYFVPPAGER